MFQLRCIVSRIALFMVIGVPPVALTLFAMAVATEHLNAMLVCGVCSILWGYMWNEILVEYGIFKSRTYKAPKTKRKTNTPVVTTAPADEAVTEPLSEVVPTATVA